MLHDLNFGEYYKNADGDVYKLICSADGADGLKVIYAHVDVSVDDLVYCSVEEFESHFKPATRFV